MSKSTDLYRKAKGIIPGGTQLLSKRPEMFLPDIWPAYYSKAKGCEIWDLDGNKYIDMCYMGIGSNVLGYAYEPVDEYAKKGIALGSMTTLNAPEEVELAELLCGLHKWAGGVRYTKSGGEAMAIAVRIARAFTNKDVVLVCGYHGWHDWYLAANKDCGDQLSGVHLKGLEAKGVVEGLSGTTQIFRYNDIDKFESLMDEFHGRIAAVVMEPIRGEQPRNDFLKKIREKTTEKGIVLVFDEISSGFRLCAGGSHLTFGVEPDIAVFAKAMTNGYPLAAIIGREKVMSAAEDTFISSTFWTERIGLMATIKAIDEYIDKDVSSHLVRIGKRVQNGWMNVAEHTSLSIDVGGIYPMSHFSFLNCDALAAKTYFTQEMLKKGYLAANAFYSSLAHTEDIVDKYLEECKAVFSRISDMISNEVPIKECLDGTVCHEGFERLNR